MNQYGRFICYSFLLNREQHETLHQEVQHSVVYFGNCEKLVFIHSGSTFCPIRNLLRELFSSSCQTGVEILIGALMGAKVLTPAMGFYSLAIQAIKGADLTYFNLN
ncbi:unknown protein [Simkania negevensis Z]|uniref:Uncharacterized protein n=1 Tax=Simkania negevensis (strain ATCC VR-1471 / DSM 27360 / Z) TaxID=331113 RepID=F8L8U6_SIMNZ|nr:unknown protein [Simkania negevensis Z]